MFALPFKQISQQKSLHFYTYLSRSISVCDILDICHTHFQSITQTVNLKCYLHHTVLNQILLADMIVRIMEKHAYNFSKKQTKRHYSTFPQSKIVSLLFRDHNEYRQFSRNPMMKLPFFVPWSHRSCRRQLVNLISMCLRHIRINH